jgi:hypothetical protein
MARMAVFRWRWVLPNRSTVEATLDASSATESVSAEGRVVSECTRGARADGHVVVVPGRAEEGASLRPPIEAVVTFAPNSPICILRIDGEEVAPSLWPARQRPEPAAETSAVPGRYILGGVGLVTLLLGTLGVRHLVGESPSMPEDVSTRAKSGLFIAHHPKAFQSHPALLPGDLDGVVLEDRATGASIVVLGGRLDPSSPRDPWILQQRFNPEARANITKTAVMYDETGRRDETCNGRPGALTLGKLVKDGSSVARLWSCAIVDDDAAYLILTALPESASRQDERRVRAIAEATELTRLGPISVPSASK